MGRNSYPEDIGAVGVEPPVHTTLPGCSGATPGWSLILPPPFGDGLSSCTCSALWFGVLDIAWSYNHLVFSEVRTLVSRSKPRAIFPKEISYCLRKIWPCFKALEVSTVFSYWCVPEPSCSIWICCRHSECLSICRISSPMVLQVGAVAESSLIWALLPCDTIPDALFRAAHTRVVCVTSKLKKTSAKCLHFGSTRWSSVFFLWRGPLDPQKLHWGSRSLGFHRLSPSLWPACDLLRHLPYVKFLPTSYSQPDIIK